MKRQIAVQKGMGNIETACSLLDTYLQIWMADIEAWSELANLRLSLGQYTQAAYCFEELILAHPLSHALHTKYAEVLYTMGGIENFRLARKYFAHALELNDSTNTRALWGLCAVRYYPSCSYSLISIILFFCFLFIFLAGSYSLE